MVFLPAALSSAFPDSSLNHSHVQNFVGFFPHVNLPSSVRLLYDANSLHPYLSSAFLLIPQRSGCIPHARPKVPNNVCQTKSFCYKCRIHSFQKLVARTELAFSPSLPHSVRDNCTCSFLIISSRHHIQNRIVFLPIMDLHVAHETCRASFPLTVSSHHIPFLCCHGPSTVRGEHSCRDSKPLGSHTHYQASYISWHSMSRAMWQLSATFACSQSCRKREILPPDPCNPMTCNASLHMFPL